MLFYVEHKHSWAYIFFVICIFYWYNILCNVFSWILSLILISPTLLYYLLFHNVLYLCYPFEEELYGSLYFRPDFYKQCTLLISMKEIETTLCVSSGKRFNVENSVLIEALGEAVEIGGLHWIINSKLLSGAQDAIAAAACRATDHLSKLVTGHWNSALASANTSVCSNLFPVNQLAAGKWLPPHLHLPK